MTHPAFLAFDSNGMWVGKFETGNSAATTTNDEIMTTIDINNIVIKPNTYSWRNITLGSMFDLSYKYLRNDESHMMKNTEWGAVAYLSHSLYGTCTSSTKCSEVRINNNQGKITGYSSLTVPLDGYGYSNMGSIPENRYELTNKGINGEYTKTYNTETGILASTTQNITGIYDMSGGSWEYVMGYSTSASAKDLSNISTLYSDFFTDNKWNKYYDKYLSVSKTDYSNRILGDATGEIGPFANFTNLDGTIRKMSSWRNDYGNFVSTGAAWFERSAMWSASDMAGIMSFGSQTGDGHMNYYTFRIVLIP